MLATNEHFLLSALIQDAKWWLRAKWGKGYALYARYLEYNARNQITLWGPSGQINDYASKQWAGVVGTYYKPRWAAFVDALVEAKAGGTPFNSTTFKAQMIVVGQEWSNATWGQTKGEKWGVQGNTWAVVDELTAKYT